MTAKPYLSVIWRDAEDGATWSSEQDAISFADQECLVESRGWLVKKTKKFMVLAADRAVSGNNPGELGRLCKIPVKMIVNMVEIEEPVYPLTTKKAYNAKKTTPSTPTPNPTTT